MIQRTAGLAAGLLLVACSSSEPSTVQVDINGDLDFSLYETFAVVDPTEHITNPPEDGEQIEAAMGAMLAAIRSEMTGQGLEEVTDGADLLAHPLVAVENYDGDLVIYDSLYGYYWGYDVRWTTPVSFNYGALAVDVVDTQGTEADTDDVLAFRGIAERVFFQDLSGNELLIRNAMFDIFSYWPVD